MGYDGLLELAFIAEETDSYGKHIDFFAQLLSEFKVLKAGCILGCGYYDGIGPHTVKLGQDLGYVQFVETVMVGVLHQCNPASLTLKFGLHQGR